MPLPLATYEETHKATAIQRTLKANTRAILDPTSMMMAWAGCVEAHDENSRRILAIP